MEEKIWNTITDSAKKRFDYLSFSKGFAGIDEKMADNLLFQIIARFATGESVEDVAHNVHTDLVATGFSLDKNELITLLSDKDEVLKLEVFLIQIANEMLQKGTQADIVLEAVNKLVKES